VTIRDERRVASACIIPGNDSTISRTGGYAVAQQAAAVIEKTQQQQPVGKAPAEAPAKKKQEPAPDPYADKSPSVRFFHIHIKPILIVAIVLLSARSSLLDWNDVPSGSMKPTILEGDRVLVNKLAYDLKFPFTTWHIAQWGNPKRGEIVVFYGPLDGIRLIKRVIGTPGDVLELRDNVLYVNGQASTYGPLSQDVINQIPADLQAPLTFSMETMPGSLKHPIMLGGGQGAKKSFERVTVPPGKYFMMGDNRDNSTDARYWTKMPDGSTTIGFADRDQIVGRAFGVAVSLDPEHSYSPRWDRFFKGFKTGETKGDGGK
jgi:signal peptidase I